MATAQSRQKSYVIVRRRQLTFEEEDWVYLKVLPMKGVKWFGLKGKMSPRYIGPYQILKKIGPITYKVALPIEYEWVHNMFHVSSLRKSYGNQQP